jgi:YHS domain-containing protein
MLQTGNVFTLSSGLLLVALTAVFCLPPKADGGGVPCIPVTQVVRGVPGLKSGEALTQRLWIAADKLLLQELTPGATPEGAVFAPRFLLRADRDPPVIYEFLPRRKTYRQWEELQNIQKDRDLYELQILEKTRSLPAEERERARAIYHVKEGLRRDVTKKEEQAPAITVGGTAYECRRVVITENGLDVVDALVTDQIDLGLDYYRFYRQLGVFSDKVLESLKTIKAFPLKAKLRVVTGKLKGFHTLSTEVVAIGPEKSLDPAVFEIPSGWALETKPLKTTCAAHGCDRQVEPLNPPGGKYIYRGRTYYFCSRECRNTFLADQRRVKMRRLKAQPPPSPPEKSPESPPPETPASPSR